MQETGYFILLLGVLVTVHELGHFLVAKWCGVKVLKFSIGFGPKLLGITKGETEYQIALLPLGGYVKMAGDVPGEELPPEEASRGFLNQPPWKRAAIVFAGPLFNLLFPILVYFFVFWGAHEVPSTRVGSVEPGMPAAVAGIRPGDRIVAVDGIKLQTFDELRDAFVDRFERPVPITVQRDGKETVFQVTPVRNVESSPIKKVERGMIGIQHGTRLPVVGVPAGSPARKAGLETFDRILAVNGVSTPDEAAVYEQLQKLQGTVTLTVMRSRPVAAGVVTGKVPEVKEVQVQVQPGEGLAALGLESPDMYVATVSPGGAAEKAGVQAGSRLVAFNDKPLRSIVHFGVELNNLEDKPFKLTWVGPDGVERTQEIAQVTTKSRNSMGQTESALELGMSGWRASAVDTAPVDKVTVYRNAGEALKQATLIVPKIVGEMVIVLGKLVTRDVSADTIGGPLMMFEMAAKTKELGFDYFLNLMALISINLGVMNLLPIPVLDGFHLVSAAWEGVRRRPIPIRVREVANMIGLAMLLLLMLLAMKNDITRAFF
jgi:regulator of sigma E protease